MGDPQSRLFSSYSPTYFVVTSLIIQFVGAFGVPSAFGILHTAPQNNYFAAAFIPLAPSSCVRRKIYVELASTNDMHNIMDEHILPTKNDGDDASEDNSPSRGRPGIVVFSGGTAFNAASAEMASRSVGVGMGHLGSIGGEGGDDEHDDVEGISRSNSLSSLVDMMVMGTMETMTSTRSGIHPSNMASGGGGLKVWHVLPVTDDGGSTAEIVRLLGGPAVGDIRSRLLRLAPGTTREARAVRRLLGHRLVSMQSLDERHLNWRELSNESLSRMAREEWLDILEGGQYQPNSDYLGRGDEEDIQGYEHPLWKDVSAPYRSVSIHICNSTLVSILAIFS